MNAPANRRVPSPWSPQSYELAYLATFAALGIAPGDSMAKRLAELTETPGELIAAVQAMRDARVYNRVFAAIDVLSAYRQHDTERAPAPEES